MHQILEKRFPDIQFYNPALTEVQEDVEIGPGTRIGSMTLIHAAARVGNSTTIGSHCNICACVIGSNGKNVSIQIACQITRGVVVEEDVFIGAHVVTLNYMLKGDPLTHKR